MSTHEVIRNVLEMPSRFHTQRNVSIVELLNQADYPLYRKEIELNDFKIILLKVPNYMIDWLKWSEDKRTHGWYIIELENAQFEVGFINSSGRKEEILVLKDKTEAFALYIKNEVDSIASRL